MISHKTIQLGSANFTLMFHDEFWKGLLFWGAGFFSLRFFND